MSEAVDKIRELNNNEETKLRIIRMQREKLHVNTTKAVAREEGRQEGLQEGLQQGQAQGEKSKEIELVKSMYKANLALEQISSITKLSIEEIKSIIK